MTCETNRCSAVSSGEPNGGTSMASGESFGATGTGVHHRLRALEEAIGDHAKWMSALQRDLLAAPATLDPARMRADDLCVLGRWLYGPSLSDEDRTSDYYHEVRRLHAEFHELAGQIIELATSGMIFDAYHRLYGDYLTMSGRLVLAMRAWRDAWLRIDGVARE